MNSIAQKNQRGEYDIMQINIKKSIMVCLLAFGTAHAALADEAQDIVTGPGKQPVRSEKFGNCVHTKWDAQSDPCAPPPPAPKHVQYIPPVEAPQPVAKFAREQLTIYFDFNKSQITADSSAKLDAIATAVNQSPKVTKVDIVGYTDQIGSNSYNEKLSVTRAKSVKAYLDTKMRIDASVLGLRGMGEKDPVVDCSNTKNRKKKIACMAKDRRVEIEFEFQK
jgi:outer membrane protein OmpA-like peptidoglycan-associated protein